LAANPPENPPEEAPEVRAARELAEAEEAAKNDPLLKALFEDRPTQEQIDEAIEKEAVIEPAAEVVVTDREKNLATLKEWTVVMPETATDAEIAAKVAEGKPAAPTAPAEPKKKKQKFSVVKTPEIVEPVEQPPAAAAPPAPPAPDTDDAAYIQTLSEEQQDELYEAEVAERLEPVKYKGMKKKLVDFFRRFDKEVPEIQAKEPGVVLEENDQFKVLVKAKPALDHITVKKVNREIGSESGAKKATSALKPQMEEMQGTQRRLELKPKFEAFVKDQFKPGINVLIESDEQSPLAEAFKVIKEKGVDEAKKDGYKLEAAIYDEEIKMAGTRAEKFLLFKNNAFPMDQAKPDPDIVFVMEMVENEGRAVADYEAKHGRIVDKARKFLPRSEFIAMLRTNPAENATLDRVNWKTKSFCTMTDIVILDSLARNAKMSIEKRIKHADETAEAAGYVRQTRNKTSPATTAPKPAPVEISPPRSTPTASVGAGKPTPPAPEAVPGIDLLAINYPHLKRR